MKILNRTQFMAMPKYTLFCKFEPHCFGELQIKHESYEHDFCSILVAHAVQTNDLGDFVEAMEKLMKDGGSIGMDFSYYGRDGQYDKDQLFAVWEKSDIHGLMEQLERCIDALLDAEPYEPVPLHQLPHLDLSGPSQPLFHLARASINGDCSCSEIRPAPQTVDVRSGFLSIERYYQPRGWVQATDEEIRQYQVEVEHQRQLREERERIYDDADITLSSLLATSTNLFAVTKKRGVCDDEECHEFVIPLAVFESEEEAEAACLTFAEARAHHDSDVFEVKPMPFFKKKGGAA